MQDKSSPAYLAWQRAHSAAERRDPLRWSKHIVHSLKQRARKKGIPFDLTPADLVVPNRCPVLGIKLKLGARSLANPSVDRFDNTKGYTKDNIRIISRRANMLKGDGTIADVRAVKRYMEGGKPRLLRGRIAPAAHAQILDLLGGGLSRTAIAAELGISKSSVNRIIWGARATPPQASGCLPGIWAEWRAETHPASLFGEGC